MKQIEKPEVGKKYFIEVEYMGCGDRAFTDYPYNVIVTGESIKTSLNKSVKFYTNEPEAMTYQDKVFCEIFNEMNKSFKPEWGKEYEFKNSDQAWRKAKFIAMDVNKPNEYLAQPDSGYIISFEHIRPITKTMEEEIVKIFEEVKAIDTSYNWPVNKIIELFSRHNQPVMPSDDAVLDYHANNGGNILATVEHFLSIK